MVTATKHNGSEGTRDMLSKNKKRTLNKLISLFFTPPLSGGLDLDSRSSGCARLGGEVGPPLGVVVELIF